MKRIYLRKSYDFSPDSKIIVNTALEKMLLKGHGNCELQITPGDSLYASQMWTKSKKIAYSDLTDGATMEIRPVLGKKLALVIFAVFTICLAVLILTKNRWSFMPLIPFVIYILLFLSIFKDRYLRIVRIENLT